MTAVKKRIRCMRNATARNPASRLTREAEQRMIAEYQASRSIVVVAPIIKNHLTLVNRVARGYVKLARNDRVYKDLVGAGVLELIHALKEYRSTESSDLGAHAERYVRRAILEELHRFNATRDVRNVWRRLANITFINTCRNCIRQCVY